LKTFFSKTFTQKHSFQNILFKNIHSKTFISKHSFQKHSLKLPVDPSGDVCYSRRGPVARKQSVRIVKTIAAMNHVLYILYDVFSMVKIGPCELITFQVDVLSFYRFFAV